MSILLRDVSFLSVTLTTILFASSWSTTPSRLATTCVWLKSYCWSLSELSRFDIDFTFPREYDQKTKTILERAAYNCPVHHTLSETVEKNISFTYLS